MRQKAFTLLETIIVLVIMTVFFAISIPLFSRPLFSRLTESTKLRTSARSVASVLRAARGYAISNNADYFVVFDDAPTPNEYFISADGANPVEKRYKLPIGITLAFDGGSQAQFTPTGELEDTDDRNIVLNDNDGNTITITLERTTGRVRLE
jgi:prepilin-type N-terminal cleavage/methylation domain-containing protein